MRRGDIARSAVGRGVTDGNGSRLSRDLVDDVVDESLDSEGYEPLPSARSLSSLYSYGLYSDDR